MKGWGFETYLYHVVSSSKTLYSPKELVIPRKRWLRPDMTEKLLNGTLNLNTNKTKNNTWPLNLKFHFYLQVKIHAEISFFEIYNEKIHDLLASSPKEKRGKKSTVSWKTIAKVFSATLKLAPIPKCSNKLALQ